MPPESAGAAPNEAGSINQPGLFTTGLVDTAAGPTSAGATVNNLTLLLTSLVGITAGSLSSGCSENPGTGMVSGDSQILGATIIGPGLRLGLHSAPNTVLAIPGVATLTLNRQRVAPDSTLTVDALSISMFGGLENIVIATSRCGRATLA